MLQESGAFSKELFIIQLELKMQSGVFLDHILTIIDIDLDVKSCFLNFRSLCYQFCSNKNLIKKPQNQCN